MLFSVSSVSKALLILTFGLTCVSSLPLKNGDYGTHENDGICKNPRVRKEWRKLSDPEKADYLRAVDCLHSIPGQYADVIDGLSVFEDYIYVHKTQTPYVHLVGHFLPWHRYFMWTYEEDLRNRCGYKGAQPYWDYSLDVPPTTEVTGLSASPIFSPDTGFGGNGQYANDSSLPGLDLPKGTGGGCVTDGPFADWTIHIGRNTTQIRDDRCLQRSLNPTIAKDWCNANVEAEIMAQKDFGWMHHVLEGEPSYVKMGVHGGGHFAVGGSASDVFTANAEPLFYLHHTNLDRMWWQWAMADPENRVWDISGPIAPWTDILAPNRTGLPTGNVTLEFELGLGRLADTIEVADLMDTEGDFLCYIYEL